MGRRPKQIFLQIHTDDQQVQEKMINITNREMQINTILRYHLRIPVSIYQNTCNKKSLQIKHVGKGVKERKLLYTVGENVNRYSHCGKQYGHISENKK